MTQQLSDPILADNIVTSINGKELETSVSSREVKKADRTVDFPPDYPPNPPHQPSPPPPPKKDSGSSAFYIDTSKLSQEESLALMNMVRQHFKN